MQTEPVPDESTTDDQLVSKSQRKREMQDLRTVAEKLVAMSDEQLSKIVNADILKAVSEYRRISKGNARKRQLQFLAKLLKSVDITDIQQLIDRYDASTRSHNIRFHQLEQWREQLMRQDFDAIEEIAAQYPATDRQHLKHLVRNAVAEQLKIEQGKKVPPAQFRKIFQYLKTLMDGAEPDA